MVEGVTDIAVKTGGRLSLGLPKHVGALTCEQRGYVESYYGNYWAFNRMLPEEIGKKILHAKLSKAASGRWGESSFFPTDGIIYARSY